MDAFESFHNDKPEIDGTSNQPVFQRSCHPNREITPEKIAPLLLPRAKEAVERMRDKITHLPHVSSFEEEISSWSVDEIRVRQSHERLLRCALMEVLEGIEQSIIDMDQIRDADRIIETWNINILPLIERVLDFCRTITDARKNTQKVGESHDNGTKEYSDAETYEDDNTGKDMRQRLSDIREYLSERARNEERSDRSKLAALRYDPFSQPEETQLNELAIMLKREGMEVTLDQRNPIVEIGFDDLVLTVSQTADCLCTWAAEVVKHFSESLLDPLSGLLFESRDELLEHLSQVDGISRFKFRVEGVNSLIFSTEIPPTTSHHLERLLTVLKSSLAPIMRFDECLGVTHSFETKILAHSVLIEINLNLPITFSRFEPDTFRLNEKILSRIHNLQKDSITQVSDLLGLDSEGLSSGFKSNNLAAQCTILTKEDKKVSFDFAWLEKLSLEGCLSALQLGARLVTSLATVDSARIFVPRHKNLPFFGSLSSESEALMVLSGKEIGAPSPYDITREVLERQRTSTSPYAEFENFSTIFISATTPIVRGESSFESLPQIVDYAREIPSFLRCVNLSTRIFELERGAFRDFISHIHSFHDLKAPADLWLLELPDPSTGASFSRREEVRTNSRFMVFSDQEVPLAQITLSGKDDSSAVTTFPREDFEALRDRIAQSISTLDRTHFVRSRELDAVFNQNGIDLNTRILERLTTLCNSVAGRTVSLLRITQTLGAFIIEPHFQLLRQGEHLSFLHISDQERF